MTPKITDDMRKAVEQQAGNPVTVEDERTRTQYVLVRLDLFQRLQQQAYDDSELTPEEMTAAASQSLSDPEGWGADSMDEYDVPEQSE